MCIRDSATTVRELQKAILYPAKHYQASKDTFEEGRKQILADLDLRVKELKRQGKDLEAHRISPVSYTHLRAHETVLDLVCRLLLEKKNKKKKKQNKKKKKKRKQKEKKRR